jgi:hypothetical protein
VRVFLQDVPQAHIDISGIVPAFHPQVQDRTRRLKKSGFLNIVLGGAAINLRDQVAN